MLQSQHDNWGMGFDVLVRYVSILFDVYIKRCDGDTFQHYEISSILIGS